MTPRPNALYYSVLEYQSENLAVLRDHFHVTECYCPTEDDTDTLATTELCFAPLGYWFDADKMDACPRLRVIASNTTSVPHIDMAGAATRGIKVVALHEDQAFLETITATAERS